MAFDWRSWFDSRLKANNFHWSYSTLENTFITYPYMHHYLMFRLCKGNSAWNNAFSKFWYLCTYAYVWVARGIKAVKPQKYFTKSENLPLTSAKTSITSSCILHKQPRHYAAADCLVIIFVTRKKLSADFNVLNP